MIFDKLRNLLKDKTIRLQAREQVTANEKTGLYLVSTPKELMQIVGVNKVLSLEDIDYIETLGHYLNKTRPLKPASDEAAAAMGNKVFTSYEFIKNGFVYDEVANKAQRSLKLPL